MTGYDLLTESARIVAALNDPEGADAETLDSTLAAWLDATEDKLGAYHAVIERLAAEDALLDAYARKLAAKRKHLATQRDAVRRLATDLLLAMEQTGEEPKVKRPEFTAYLSRSESVTVAPDAALPEGCSKVAIVPDKGAIKAALKKGDTIPGCALVESRAVVFR